MHIASSLLILPPGMYVLRHPKAGLPALSVARAPASTDAHNGKLELLSTPRTHGSILRDGADCIVMHVSEAPVELVVSAYLAQPGTTIPALKVDRIALDTDAAVARAEAPATGRPIVVSEHGISLVGHIERTGDVVAGEHQRLGDPSTTLRIEGFQVEWPDRPEGVDLAYSIAVEGVGALPMATTGSFCGTRGQARRITEVTFVLVGPNAAQYELEGSACFTGGFVMPLAAGMPSSGPSGLEHLTSLSVQARKAGPEAKPAVNPWDESATTKVFKSPRTVRKKPPSKSEKFAAS